MARVELLHDTVVRFKSGSLLEVSDDEAWRLAAFGNAKIIEEPAAEKPAKKQSKKRS